MRKDEDQGGRARITRKRPATSTDSLTTLGVMIEDHAADAEERS